jgi:anti-anti-sigma factor
MEITTEQDAAIMRVHVSGRLDGHWAGHLTQALDEQLRQGNDRVCLHIEGLNYVSSLGLRVLIGAYNRFRSVSGSFSVTGATGNVLEVLRMAGMFALLDQSSAAAPAKAPVAAAAPAAPQSERVLHGAVAYEIFRLGETTMRAVAFGDPTRLGAGGYAESDCRSLPLDASVVGLGLGAFGQDFAGNRDRFGEYLTVAGAAAYQPSGASSTCDTLLTEGDYVPELQALYGMRFEGSFSYLIRFEPAAEDAMPTLSDVAAFALERSGAAAVCLVFAAETDGLVGAVLRRSPVVGEMPADPFAFPDVRDWLSVVNERAHAGLSVVACGAAADPLRAGELSAGLRAQLRPLAAADGPLGHVHAAVFRYRPLQRGKVELAATLRPFFEHDSPQAVVHLLADDREEGTMEQTRLRRGVCWVSPVTDISGGAA